MAFWYLKEHIRKKGTESIAASVVIEQEERVLG